MKLHIGIDLGTSNSAIARASVENQEPEIIPVIQVSSAGSIGEDALFASALYIPIDEEAPKFNNLLPWAQPMPEAGILGNYARQRGALNPERLISSAKSWLCQGNVDRLSPILPWQSECITQKHSPFDVTKLYLQHLLSSLQHTLPNTGQYSAAESDSTDIDLTLTVPASFDEVARSLTHRAAQAAGIENLTLLEEPQAAFYAWLAHVGKDWRKHVNPGDLVLVCDVGGGTADFSLIAIAEVEGNLQLERVSVGDHILLGGDNMDHALAYLLQEQAESSGHSIDAWQFLTLIDQARRGKERLLSDDNLEIFPISLPTRGSKLFSQDISLQLSKQTVQDVILDGFFPITANPTDKTAEPQSKPSLGLQELGLSYAYDPAISKHLLRFLRRSLMNVTSDNRLSALLAQHLNQTNQDILLPNKVLYNGGVFKSSAIRQRLNSIIAGWRQFLADQNVDSAGLSGVNTSDINSSRIDIDSVELSGANYDMAVAKGAAYYNLIRSTGSKLRIRSGTSRSYYIGLEAATLAVPGIKPKVKGVCIVPQGTEEGSELQFPEQQFSLLVGENVQFRFFCSEVRAGDRLGSIVNNAERELAEVDSLFLTLPPLENDVQGDSQGEARSDVENSKTSSFNSGSTSTGGLNSVTVFIQANITDVGILELWLHHTTSAAKWKLEYKVRDR